MRSLILLVLVLSTAAATSPAGAQGTETTAGQTTAQLKARCSQLIAYFDRFGAGRSNNSDGRRNHTRLAAEIDCSNGLYDRGIAEMEALLRRKKFTPPPPGPDEPEDDN